MLQQAKEAVEEGMGLLRTRQKTIRLAEKSKLGWAVVNEHGEDELADDSDDEKRIAKVVASAERKASQSKKRKTGHGGMSGLCGLRRSAVQGRPPARPGISGI